VSPGAAIDVRPLRTQDDFIRCVELQHDVWGATFTERVSVGILKVVQRIGGIAAGAFEEDGRLGGFVFGLTGVEEGRLVHWSDMLAVREHLRDHGIGRRLKEFQRDTVREIGVSRIYWTFDPLVSRNAHFNLIRLGAHVVHQGNAKVHVSGHAAAGELLFLYNAVRPSNVMPVHGEWKHLRANAELAIRTGVAAEQVIIAEDGVVVDLIDGKAAISGRVEVGHVYVDGLSVGDVGESTLSDRLVLGEGGFISITVAVETATGRAVAPPTISGRGFSDDPKALDQVVPLVEMELSRTESEGITDTHRIAQSVRRVVGRWVAETYRRRPMIIPTVIPV